VRSADDHNYDNHHDYDHYIDYDNDHTRSTLVAGTLYGGLAVQRRQRMHQ
jgi:hypothetical protein